MIRQLNVEGAVTGGSGAFLCVRAVKKNPKRGGLGTIHAWGLRQPSSGCQ